MKKRAGWSVVRGLGAYTSSIFQLQPEMLPCRLKLSVKQLYKQFSFLSKIQNLTSEKTRKKILLLSCKKLVKTQFLGVVVFPSIFWFQNIKVVVFPSNFLFQNFKVVVFPSNFWKTTMIWQFFTVILNFSQECYYLKNKVGVVDFTKARGLVKFQSPRGLRALGL